MSAFRHARIAGLVFITSLLCAWAAAPAWSAAPAGYAELRVGPSPVGGQGFGRALTTIDTDFDGVSELVTSVPGATSGEIEVAAYKTDGQTFSTVWSQTLDPDPAGSSRYETSVAAVLDPVGGKDLNGDFVADVLASAVDPDPAGGDQGVVFVLDGATGGLLKRIELPAGDQPAGGTGEFGRSLLAPGDLAIGDTFDELPDLLVGAPGWSGGGRVYVYRGSDITGDPNTSIAPAHTIQNPYADVGRFGQSLIPIGDVGHCIDSGGGVDCVGASAENRTDGAPDVFVGAPGTVVAGLPGAGAALLLDARRGKVIRKVDNPAPQIDGDFGRTLYSPSTQVDFNGDGTTDGQFDANGDAVPDAFVGAPGHDADRGTGYFLNGDLNGPAVATPRADPDGVSPGRFGVSALGLGPDGFAVGAPYTSGWAGEVRLFNANRTLARTICNPDNQAGAHFGASVVSLGYVNADAFPDIAVGAPEAENGGVTDAGLVYVLTSIPPEVTGRRATCQRPAAPRPTGGEPEPDPFGDGFDDGTPDSARVLRRLEMKPSKSRVRKAVFFRLRGRLTASAQRNVCQRRQKIALQRRRGKGNRFQTFEVAVTRASGRFTAKAIASRTYTYRARASQTSRCTGAVSKTSKVRILRSRAAR